MGEATVMSVGTKTLDSQPLGVSIHHVHTCLKEMVMYFHCAHL